MQYRHALESCAKPRPALPPDPQRQRDLRHQNDRRLPARQRVLHRAQIHFRFSTARHAVQQLHAEFAKLESRANCFQYALLLRVQFMRRRNIPRIKRVFRWIDWLLPAFKESVSQHPVDQCASDARQLQKLRQRQGPALGFKQRANSLLLFRQRFRLFTFGRCDFPRHDALYFTISLLHCFANFDQSVAL